MEKKIFWLIFIINSVFGGRINLKQQLGKIDASTSFIVEGTTTNFLSESKPQISITTTPLITEISISLSTSRALPTIETTSGITPEKTEVSSSMLPIKESTAVVTSESTTTSIESEKPETEISHETVKTSILPIKESTAVVTLESTTISIGSENPGTEITHEMAETSMLPIKESTAVVTLENTTISIGSENPGTEITHEMAETSMLPIEESTAVVTLENTTISIGSERPETETTRNQQSITTMPLTDEIITNLSTSRTSVFTPETAAGSTSMLLIQESTIYFTRTSVESERPETETIDISFTSLKKTNNLAIIGGTIGGFIGVVIIVGAIVFTIKIKKNAKIDIEDKEDNEIAVESV